MSLSSVPKFPKIWRRLQCLLQIWRFSLIIKPVVNDGARPGGNQISFRRHADTIVYEICTKINRPDYKWAYNSMMKALSSIADKVFSFELSYQISRYKSSVKSQPYACNVPLLSTLHSSHLPPKILANFGTLSINFFIASLCRSFPLTLNLNLYLACSLLSF